MLYLLLKLFCGVAQLTVNVKRFSNFEIVFGIGFSQVVKKAASLGNDLQKTTARVVVFFVDFEVVGKLFNLRSEKSNLHARRASIFVTGGKLLNNVYFGIGFKSHIVCIVTD